MLVNAGFKVALHPAPSNSAENVLMNSLLHDTYSTVVYCKSEENDQ